MGRASIDAARLVRWFHGRQPQPAGTYNATVPVETLTQLFVEEGAAEGVKGDVAFVQSIVETGWYRFGGSVPSWNNNFAGIGATDSDPAPAAFPDAAHRRARADPAPSRLRRRGRDHLHRAAAPSRASTLGSTSSRRRARPRRGTRWATATGRRRRPTRRRSSPSTRGAAPTADLGRRGRRVPAGGPTRRRRGPDHRPLRCRPVGRARDRSGCAVHSPARCGRAPRGASRGAGLRPPAPRSCSRRRRSPVSRPPAAPGRAGAAGSADRGGAVT